MVHLEAFLDEFRRLDPKSQHLVAQLTRQLHPNGSHPDLNPPLSELVQPWLSDMANHGKSLQTCRRYFYCVRKFLAQHPSPNPIDIDTHFTFLRGRASLRVLASTAAALRSFFRFCETRGLLVADLRDATPIVKVTQKRRLAAPPEDIAVLLSYDQLKPRTRAFIHILTDSGARLAEVLSIRRSDIDLRELRITIMGKGARERIIYISPETGQAIKEYLAQAPQSTYLFPGQRSLTWSQQAVRQHLALLCHKLGIKRFTPHQLRHLFATKTINAGANIRSISEILGHKSPAVTLEVYCHTDDELNRQEHRKYSPLADILSRATEIQRERTRSKKGELRR